MRKFIIWATLILVITLTVNANAATITFTHEGIGSGTINNTSFSNAGFTITAIVDTVNRVSFTHGFFINHDSASISINGVGIFDFITETRTYVNNYIPEVGFSRAGIPGWDLIGGPINDVFTSWDMLSSIGPISGIGGLIQWNYPPYPPVITDKGVLVFNDGMYQATFEAEIAPIPEPPTMLLLGSGLVGLLGFRKKFKK